MNSFIAWIGGKKLLRKHIIEKFPDDIDRYIEVFGGAGWVMFGKDPGKHLEVFNDIDSNLINLYRCIKYHCSELQKELEWLIVSREQFFDYKGQLNSNGLTDIQRAARYFYIIKSSFGADRRTFGTNKKNLVSTIDYLTEVNERLKNVVIENLDYERLIKVYDRPNALFYLDPPYLGTEKFYDSGFNIDDHIKLNSLLKQIKGRFILSYNDSDYIRELYRDFIVERVARNNNLASKFESNEFKEVIITNY
jgi:DNA adenine methylase